MRTGGVAFGHLPIDVRPPYKKLKPYEHLTLRYHMPEKNVVFISLSLSSKNSIFGARDYSLIIINKQV